MAAIVSAAIGTNKYDWLSEEYLFLFLSYYYCYYVVQLDDQQDGFCADLVSFHEVLYNILLLLLLWQHKS